MKHFLAFIALCSGPVLAAQSPVDPRTVAEILAEHHLDATGRLPADLLDKHMNGHIADEDEQEFVMAFLEDPAISTPESYAHVVRFDRKTGIWYHANVSAALSPGNAIMRLKRAGGFIYVDSHINPSAGMLLVLSPDLKGVQSLFGYSELIFPNGVVVYAHSQTHFAPTHQLGMSVFDPRSGASRQIYPPRPTQPVRSRFIEQVREEYQKRGEAWFREHNHHMDPDRFDSDIRSEVSFDPSTNQISFEVGFGDPQNANDPLPFSENVMVTCGPVTPVDAIRCSER